MTTANRRKTRISLDPHSSYVPGADIIQGVGIDYVGACDVITMISSGQADCFVVMDYNLPAARIVRMRRTDTI